MILGQSKSILKVNALIHKVAKANASILITGESGTGKELVARMIHQESDVSRSPFVAVNCGAIPESLIESELFGHKRGSFTGAVADKIGLFQAAEDGTLFLDEIGELPLSMQVKLLRALQERKVRRVGDNEDQKVSARIIAATNRDLEIEVSQGRFREDLYYRLNVIQITTPPLRDRDDDILLLADYFLNQLAKKKKATPKKLTEEVKDLFKSYSWPGNVRELENTVERLVTLENTDIIETTHLPDSFRRHKGSGVGTEAVGALGPRFPDFHRETIDLDKTLAEYEQALIRSALLEKNGDFEKASKALGISVKNLDLRIKKSNPSRN